MPRVWTTHLLAPILLTLLLAGCEEQQAAEARQALARCKLDRRARDYSGLFDMDFLTTCMQASGFVLDLKMPSGGWKCSEVFAPEGDAACYRMDNWFGEQLTNSKPSN